VHVVALLTGLSSKIAQICMFLYLSYSFGIFHAPSWMLAVHERIANASSKIHLFS